MMRTRHRRPDRQLLDDVARVCAERGLNDSGVLAWGSGPLGTAMALRDCLAVYRDDGWELIDWHLVVHGGLRPGPELWWELIDGEQGVLPLDDPGRLPEVFKERVTASIMVHQHVELPGGRKAIISARRASGDRITWNVIGLGGVDLGDPETRELLADRTRRLRADYGE